MSLIQIELGTNKVLSFNEEILRKRHFILIKDGHPIIYKFLKMIIASKLICKYTEQCKNFINFQNINGRESCA